MRGNEAHDVMLKIQAFFAATLTTVSRTKRFQPPVMEMIWSLQPFCAGSLMMSAIRYARTGLKRQYNATPSQTGAQP